MKRKLNKQNMKTLLKYLSIGIGIVVVCVVIYLSVGILSQVSGFSKQRLLSEESSILYDANGDEYYLYGQNGLRKNVKYDDIPQIMIDAIVAAEDSRYFEHNGFDLPRIVKALMSNLAAGGIRSGGSTITQQVIKKSYYPDEEQTIERKVGEIILSIQATNQVTKEEILELYLNKIYFGATTRTIGIYAASQYYFGKEVQELTLPEAALLAGTLNSPYNYDPFRNLDLAQKRRDIILDLMYSHGYISEEECERTKKVPVENTLYYNPLGSSGDYQAYIDKVTREVEEKTGMNPNTTSLKIYTYMDQDLQSGLDQIASGETYTFVDDLLEVGATVTNLQGQIVGLISGRNYEPMGTTYAYAASKESGLSYGQRNQPGSSLKPIIAYAAAFEFLDYSTAHIVHDIPYVAGDWSPKNYNGKIYGDITIKSALVNSWNLSAIDTYNEVIAEVGKGTMKEYLEGFGFDMYGEDGLGPQYAIGGWSTGVSTEEAAGAYAAIANGGTYIEPHTVARIEVMSTGQVIDFEATYKQESVQAISEESAFMIRDIMVDYTASGQGQYSRLNLGYQIGAKTGTTNHSSDVNQVVNKNLVGKSKDGWLNAFSPDYSWSVWIGYPADAQRDGKYLSNGSDASKVSAAIAKLLHKDGVSNSYSVAPSGIVQAQCIQGLYPYVTPGSNVDSSRIVTGWFKTNNTPSSSLSTVTVNNLTQFSVSEAGGAIAVEFEQYDPVSMTEPVSLTKTYTIGGKSYTLPYLGNLNQIYGRIVYKVDVYNSTGSLVHSETLYTNSGTLSFAAGNQTYTVNGYYAFESGSASSNILSQNVTITQAAIPLASYSVESLTSDTIVLNVNVPAGKKLSVTINGMTREATTSGQFTIDQLQPDTDYTISFIDISSSGMMTPLSDYSFKTPALSDAAQQAQNALDNILP